MRFQLWMFHRADLRTAVKSPGSRRRQKIKPRFPRHERPADVGHEMDHMRVDLLGQRFGDADGGRQHTRPNIVAFQSTSMICSARSLASFRRASESQRSFERGTRLG